MQFGSDKVIPTQDVNLKFDWYSATVPHSGDPMEVAERLSSLLNTQIRVPDRKRIAQYQDAYDLIDLDAWFEGRSDDIDGLQGFVCYNGVTANMKHPHVRSTGREADGFAKAVKKAFPDHKVSRVDVCFDVTGPGLFEEVHAIMDGLYETKHIARRSFGFAAPENGRSFYLGSKNSPVQVRCYEKGLKWRSEGFHDVDPHHVRVEIQVKPLTAQKALFGRLDPFQIWGAARWSRDLLQLICGLNPATVKREPPTLQRSPRQKLEMLMEQYKRTIDEGSADLSDDEILAFFGRGPLAGQLRAMDMHKRKSFETRGFFVS